jgi:hypothetical protein
VDVVVVGAAIILPMDQPRVGVGAAGMEITRR